MSEEWPRDPVAAAARLRDEVALLVPEMPAAWVYNPLAYCWDVHAAFLERFGRGKRRAVFVGMNPGPWGMGQTGVPFGDPQIVTERMGIRAVQVTPPTAMHPKRPVLGLGSKRKEGSGQRLYGLLEALFGDLDAFFDIAMIVNYCPLLFLDHGN